MQRIDRQELGYQLHNQLTFAPRRIHGLRAAEELASGRGVAELLERLLDEIYRDGAVLIRPSKVFLKNYVSPLAFGNEEWRPGVFGEDEPHPCPDRPPSKPPGT